MYFQNKQNQEKFFLYLVLICTLLFTVGNATRLYKPVIEDPLLEKWRWVKFPELSSKGVQCMVEDNQKTMWFGLDNGVISYDGSEWNGHNRSTGFTNGTVRVLSFSETGLLYAGSDSGLFVYRDDNWQSLFTTKNIPGLMIQSILDIPQKGIFCGTNYGLIWIQNSNTHIYTTELFNKNFKDTNFIINNVPEIITISTSRMCIQINRTEFGSLLVLIMVYPGNCFKFKMKVNLI